MEEYKVIGKQLITSKKDGKTYIKLHCVKDFDKRQKHCEGEAVENLFFEFTGDIPVGSFVSPVYAKSFNGNAILVDVRVLSEEI